MIPIPDITTSIEIAVGASHAEFGSAMAAGQLWEFCSNTNCWIKQGSAPVASAASGSMFVPALKSVYIDGKFGANLSVIQDSAGGKATLTRLARDLAG